MASPAWMAATDDLRFRVRRLRPGSAPAHVAANAACTAEVAMGIGLDKPLPMRRRRAGVWRVAACNRAKQSCEVGWLRIVSRAFLLLRTGALANALTVERLAHKTHAAPFRSNQRLSKYNEG